jgi:hypothetical protein
MGELKESWAVKDWLVKQEDSTAFRNFGSIA